MGLCVGALMLRPRSFCSHKRELCKLESRAEMRFSTNKPELQYRTCCSTFKGPVHVIMDKTRRGLIYPAQTILRTSSSWLLRSGNAATSQISLSNMQSFNVKLLEWFSDWIIQKKQSAGDKSIHLETPRMVKSDHDWRTYSSDLTGVWSMESARPTGSILPFSSCLASSS